MELSIPPILLSLLVQSGLNWSLVFFQRGHVSRSFLGVFGVSLAVVDATATLCVGVLSFAEGPLTVLGLRFTRFHICLLVQILGQVYSSLQGPVLALAAVDHFCRSRPTAARLSLYILFTAFLWLAAIFYVFFLSDFAPQLEDVPYSQIRQCWVFPASQVLPVATVALALGCAAVHVGHWAGFLKDPRLKARMRAEGWRGLARRATETLLSTWAPLLLLLLLLALLLLLLVGVPAHLGLNAAWICVLHSLLTAALLCVAPPAVRSAQAWSHFHPTASASGDVSPARLQKEAAPPRQTPVVSRGR